MTGNKQPIVTECAKMWPRDVFYAKDANKFDPEVKRRLSKTGVYVLYRDDKPYYVGKASNKSNKLFSRLRSHAVNPKDEYYNFWNYFSAFVVPDLTHVREVEGILIAAMPTDNRAIPRTKKIPIPPKIASLLREQRAIPIQRGKPS